jgi:hypothetical protein
MKVNTKQLLHGSEKFPGKDLENCNYVICFNAIRVHLRVPFNVCSRSCALTCLRFSINCVTEKDPIVFVGIELEHFIRLLFHRYVM